MQNYFNIKEIKPADYNPRIMPDKEMEALKNSLISFGFVEPVVINTNKERYGTLVGGHQRLTALSSLLAVKTIPAGVLDEPDGYKVPAVLVDLDVIKEKALNLALNKIKGRWDDEKLTSIIVDIKAESIIPATGFSEDEISRSVFANFKKFLRAGGVYYICSGYGSYPTFFYSLRRIGLHLSSVIMWIKLGGQMAGWQEYHRRHEQIIKGKNDETLKKAKAIIYGWEPNDTHKFYGGFDYDVWEMPRKKINNYIHPTEKPDWLPMRAIRNSSKRNDIILDPFAGSGSVMAAAEKTGRRAFMIELDPKFADVIRNRWAKIEKAKNENKES